MPKLMRKLAVLSKIEGTYNTDSVPTGAANAMIMRNAKLTPLQLDTEGRVIIRPFLGNDEKVVTGMYAMLDGEIEIAGAGAAGTVPKYGCHLRAAGLSETISAGVSVAYGPVSSGFESESVYANLDGTNFRLTGVRTDVSLGFDARKIPVYKVRIMGLYNDAADVALPAVTLTGWQLPVAVNKVNTPTFTLHGYAGVLQSLSLDLKNQLVYRNLVNSESIQLVDREPAGQVVMEATSVATKDWFTTIKNGTTGALQLIHGTAAGNIVQLDAPKVQLINPQFSESDGIAMMTCDLAYMPNAGNDEFTITVK